MLFFRTRLFWIVCFKPFFMRASSFFCFFFSAIGLISNFYFHFLCCSRCCVSFFFLRCLSLLWLLSNYKEGFPLRCYDCKLVERVDVSVFCHVRRISRFKCIFMSKYSCCKCKTFSMVGFTCSTDTRPIR